MPEYVTITEYLVSKNFCEYNAFGKGQEQEDGPPFKKHTRHFYGKQECHRILSSSNESFVSLDRMFFGITGVCVLSYLILLAHCSSQCDSIVLGQPEDRKR